MALVAVEALDVEWVVEWVPVVLVITFSFPVFLNIADLIVY